MNYRHSFHAGNFADVLKHAILVRLLLYLRRKDKPFRYLDTHAGAGRYNLSSEDSLRADEWRSGIGALLELPKDDPAFALLQDYIGLVEARDDKELWYPGSPAIAQAFLRPQDRALFYETQPKVFDALVKSFARDRRVKCLALDGWMGLKAATPPPERRGLALIDPPFENIHEYSTIALALETAWRKWPDGIYAIWRPIKDFSASEQFVKTVRDFCSREILDLQISGRLSHNNNKERKGTSPALQRSGILIVNPPYSLLEETHILMPTLARVFSHADAGQYLVRRFPERKPTP